MQQLSPSQLALVRSLTAELSNIEGVRAVVLGGSYARGRARPDSDIDLGILYSDQAPLSIEGVRELGRRVDDGGNPVVTGLFEWGPWVNGGSWLTIGGQRVDFLYRSLEQLENTIAQAQAGHYDHDYWQQPPFGYCSDTYLAEVVGSVALFDPEGRVEALKRAVATYPEALRRSLVRDGLGSARFDMYATRSAAESANAYLTAACATRIVNRLVHALFALNRSYRVNDKTVLLEISEFERAPRDFAARVQAILSHVGATATELGASVSALEVLVDEVLALSEDLLRIDESSPAWLRHFAHANGET